MKSTITSRDIADKTGRRHKDVLLLMRQKMAGTFTHEEYIDVTGRSRPMYRVDDCCIYGMLEKMARIKPKKDQTAINPETPARTEWYEMWDKLTESNSMLYGAMDRLHDEIAAMIVNHKLSDDHGFQQYLTELENATKQVHFLSTMLMWMSPRVTALSLSLGKPE